MVGGHLGDRDYLIGLQAAVFLCVHLLLLSLASATVRLLSLLLIMRLGSASQVRLYKFAPVHRSACLCTIFLSLLFVVLWAPPRPADAHAAFELMDVCGKHPQAMVPLTRSGGSGLGCVR